jgi:HlyD family secretion protein
MKWIAAALALAGLAYGAFRLYGGGGNGAGGSFDFVEIKRGDLVDLVSSSGTLKPVTTVDVGTQISGIVDEVFVDYNDVVKKDQLLATLDTSVLQESVREAKAQLQSAYAQYAQAKNEYDRTLPLFKSKFVSESEFLPAKTQLSTTRSQVQSARSQVERAERNLSYASIRSPIDGVVISRSVEAGQTMAASFNAPVLFQIAEDLSSMEIIAQVDESDIAQVKVGQRVRFTVQAYPDQTFGGVVEQIRLQPVTVSNVVNYEVVVSAANDQNLLLPGMTAEVDFIVAESKDVLMVKNSALKWEPTAEMMGANQPGPKEGPKAGKERPANLRRLWYVDKGGALASAPVLIGLTDGVNTELVESKQLGEGAPVISGFTPGASGAKSKGISLIPTPPRRGGGGPRF